MRWRRYWSLGLIAGAFAYVEAAVVVYLRALFGVGDRLFPLRPVEPYFVGVELGREIATLLLLWGAGAAFAQGDRWRTFFAFMVLFGLWDLFYYFWLKVLTGWPPRWTTPDILFLIPWPWVGPWITPALVALLLVVAGLAYLELQERGWHPEVHPLVMTLGLNGSLLVLFSFWAEPLSVLIHQGQEGLWTYVPRNFPWFLYLPGLGLMIAASLLFPRFRKTL